MYSGNKMVTHHYELNLVIMAVIVRTSVIPASHNYSCADRNSNLFYITNYY